MTFKKDFVAQKSLSPFAKHFFGSSCEKSLSHKKKDSKGLSTHLQIQLQVT
jgi:hypothetical protein